MDIKVKKSFRSYFQNYPQSIQLHYISVSGLTSHVFIPSFSVEHFKSLTDIMKECEHILLGLLMPIFPVPASNQQH